MDPITLFTMALLGGAFMLNQLAGASKKKDGGTKPADQTNGTSQERVGSGGSGGGGLSTGSEARQLPAQHLRVSEEERATAPDSPAAPADVLSLQMVRDRNTGRWSKRLPA